MKLRIDSKLARTRPRGAGNKQPVINEAVEVSGRI